jgi:hypothetical protein
VVYRRGELSKHTIDRDWPHQVALPAYRCTRETFYADLARAATTRATRRASAAVAIQTSAVDKKRTRKNIVPPEHLAWNAAEERNLLNSVVGGDHNGVGAACRIFEWTCRHL